MDEPRVDNERTPLEGLFAYELFAETWKRPVDLILVLFLVTMCAIVVSVSYGTSLIVTRIRYVTERERLSNKAVPGTTTHSQC